MNDYDSDDIFFMLSKGIFLGYFTFEHIFDNKVGLGRAKTRPEIWPVGHGFWVARPDPGHIIEGP